MGKVIKNYMGLCPSCNGTGYISDFLLETSSSQRLCPACNGAKVILISEVKDGEV